MYERVFIAALDAHLDETAVVSSHSGSAAITQHSAVWL